MPGIIAPLFRIDFWFHVQPIPFIPWVGVVIFWVMIGLLVISLLSLLITNLASRGVEPLHHVLDKPMRQMWRAISRMTFIAGLSGLLLYWFTWDGVPFLSMRIFFLVWFIIFAWWKILILRQAKKRKTITDPAKEAYEKWLPKPKR